MYKQKFCFYFGLGGYELYPPRHCTSSTELGNFMPGLPEPKQDLAHTNTSPGTAGVLMVPLRDLAPEHGRGHGKKRAAHHVWCAAAARGSPGLGFEVIPLKRTP